MSRSSDGPFPTRSLPASPNLDQLKKQAKELLRAFREGDAAARDEVARFERSPDAAAFRLNDAQRVLARAYGFESWAKLIDFAQPGRRASRRMRQPPAMATPRYAYGVEALDGHDAWALMCACADGDAAAADALLKKDPRLANAQYWYQFPIHMAVREGDAEVVRRLLDAGAEPGQSRATYNSWDKLLDIARYRGYAEVAALLESTMKRRFCYDPAFERLRSAIVARDAGAVRAVLAAEPALLHASDAFGRGPLHWAVLTRQLALIDEFLARGADIHARRADGQAPIHQTLNGDYWFRDNRDVPDHTIRDRSVLTGYLLAKGAAMDLCVAAAIGDGETIRRTLAEDPAAAHRLGPAQIGPLFYAARAGHLKIVQLLLDHGVDPNTPEQGAPRGHALFEACAEGHLEIAELLLRHGADPNAEVDSSGSCLTICELSPRGNVAELQALLRKHGARTPPWRMSRDELYDALRNRDPVIRAAGAVGGDWGTFLQAVLKHEDDAELLALYLSTAGDEAIRAMTANHLLPRSERVIDLLVEHGLDVNRPDWRGRTFLHAAAEGGHLEAAAAYLKHGADIDAVDLEFSFTPLGAAVRGKKLEMMKFLLDQGANPELPGGRPWASPLAYAKTWGHEEIARVLEAQRRAPSRENA